METYAKICPVCDEPFTVKRKNAKTCSQKCRNALSIGRRLINNQSEKRILVVTKRKHHK